MALTKEQILAAGDLRIEPVDVPEWGGGTYVRMMTGAERDSLENAVVAGREETGDLNLSNYRARVVMLTCCDATGCRLFDDSDLEKVGGKSAVAIGRVFKAASKLNMLGAEGTEEAAKN